MGAGSRLGQFLDITDRHDLSVMVCLFDDCAFSGKQPYLGRQDDPIPGVHNSGWTPSPGHARVDDRAAWPALERYVTGVISRFADDARVVAWDLYNEPGNSELRARSLPLLERAFEWARDCGPSQPLTVGIWTPELPDLNECALRQSDIISFHNYGDLDSMARQIAWLKSHSRPVVCTEWMRRTGGSVFSTHLPLLKSEGVGCYFWGLVNGRTQTQFPWGSPAGAPEPETWFHDLLRTDGRPYSEDEIALLKKSAGFPR